MSYFSLGNVSAYSAIVPAIVGLYYWYIIKKPMRFLVVLVICSLMFDYLGHRSAVVYGNNSFVFNVFILAQYLLVGLYFVTTDTKGVLNNRLVKVIYYSLWPILLFLFFQGDYQTGILFNVLAISIVGILFFCLLYLLNIVQYELDTQLITFPDFYAVAGLFLYCSTTLTIFLTGNLFEVDVSVQLWKIKQGGYIVFNLFLIVAFYLNSKTKK